MSEATSSTFMQSNDAYQKVETQNQILEYDGYVSLPLQESGPVDPIAKICKAVNEEEPTYASIQ